MYILKSLLQGAGKRQETLFLFSITWCLLIVALFGLLGFSLEMGAFVAGVLLASTPYAREISSRIKPLRDFFIVLFFIVLGAGLSLESLSKALLPAVYLSLFILIGNLLIVYIIMGGLGFSKRIAFFTGTYIAQISEFSLIIIAMGLSVGHLSDEVAAVATITALITITVSTYMINKKDAMYNRFGKKLPYYRRGVHRHHHQSESHVRPHDVVLFGYERIGKDIVEHLRMTQQDFLVIDYNPQIILDLQEKGQDAIFGDAEDIELYEGLQLGKTKLLVSSIPDVMVSQMILEQGRKANPDMVIIMTSPTPEDALELYERGADYVIIPHILGGEHATNMLELMSTDLKSFLGKKHAHVSQLKLRGQR